MLLRQALQVNAFGDPANALSLYMSTDDEDELAGSDLSTLHVLRSRLKTLEAITFPSTTVPFTVLSSSSKPAFFSYAYAYGPQQTEHPLDLKKNAQIGVICL